MVCAPQTYCLVKPNHIFYFFVFISPKKRQCFCSFENKLLYLHNFNLTTMAEHNDVGKWGENLAVRYLHKNGYTIRECDWRYGHRDIDIIALSPDQRYVVFVEVKTRTANDVVTPEEAVDKQKIKNLGYAANAYVKLNQIVLDLRFDILTIVGNKDSEPIIDHIEDAFNPMF